VAARHRDVVEKDLALGVAADMGDLRIEHVLGADVRSALDHEDTGAVGQLGDTDVDLVLALLT
jgi:hypothetical protein